MIYEETKLARICHTYCPHYRLLISLLQQAEQNIMMAKHGRGSTYERDLCKVMFDVLADPGALEHRVVLGVWMSDTMIIRREQRFSSLTLEFMNASDEKWLPEVDKLIHETISAVFTAGAFKFSQMKVLDGVFEEKDEHTL